MISRRMSRLRLLSSSMLMYSSVSFMYSPAPRQHSALLLEMRPWQLFHSHMRVLRQWHPFRLLMHKSPKRLDVRIASSPRPPPTGCLTLTDAVQSCKLTRAQ